MLPLPTPKMRHILREVFSLEIALNIQVDDKVGGSVGLRSEIGTLVQPLSVGNRYIV